MDAIVEARVETDRQGILVKGKVGSYINVGYRDYFPNSLFFFLP